MALELLTANVKGGNVRRENLEGKPHVVVDAVMMTSGVVPGSKGPLYYPPEEMRKNVQAWNNRPVVVYHPQNGDGKPATAADPKVLNTQKVGVVLNAHYTEKNGKPRWRSQVWINEELGKKLIPDVMAKIEKGEPVEVSTGLYTENEEKEGTYNGKKYKAIAKNYVPDHLAILPTGTGACSVADGAGLLQNAAKCGGKCGSCGEDLDCPTCGKSPTANAMSYSKVFQIIQKGLDDKFGPYRVSVQDVYPGFVVFGRRTDNGELKLYKQDYKVDNRKNGESAKVMFVGDSTQVERITEYRTTDGKFVGNSLYSGNTPEREDMDKTKIVESVIANSNGQLDEADREWLMKKSEAWLAALPGGAPAAAPVPAPAPAPVANAAPAAKPTFQELLQNADPATQEAIQEAMAAREIERGKLIQTITANAKNTFTADQLKAFKLPDLRALALLAAPAVQAQPAGPVANWAGAAGFAPPVANGSPAEAPLLPTPPSSRPAK